MQAERQPLGRMGDPGFSTSEVQAFPGRSAPYPELNMVPVGAGPAQADYRMEEGYRELPWSDKSHEDLGNVNKLQVRGMLGQDWTLRLCIVCSDKPQGVSTKGTL